MFRRLKLQLYVKKKFLTSDKIKKMKNPRRNSMKMGNEGNILLLSFFLWKYFVPLWVEKNTGFPPESTMELLALKCSNGQESPSQKLPISSSFVFWKNIIFVPYENNIDPKNIAWKNFDFVRVQVKFKFRFASLRPPFAFLLLYFCITLSLNSIFFCM